MSFLPDAAIDRASTRDICEFWYTVRMNLDRWIQCPDRLWRVYVVEVVGVRVFNDASSHCEQIRDPDVDDC